MVRTPVGLSLARVERCDRQALLRVAVEESSRSQRHRDTGDARVAVEAGRELLEGQELRFLEPAPQLVVVEPFELLVDLGLLAVEPRDIVVAGEQNRSPARQAEAVDDGAEEGTCLLELLRVPCLGKVAGGDHEIDLGGDPEPLAAGLELGEEPLGEARGLQLAEPAVGSEVQVREVEKEHRREILAKPCRSRKLMHGDVFSTVGAGTSRPMYTASEVPTPCPSTARSSSLSRSSTKR